MESRAAGSLYVATAFTAFNGHNKFEVVGNAAAAVCGRSIFIINSRYYNKDICYAAEGAQPLKIVRSSTFSKASFWY